MWIFFSRKWSEWIGRTNNRTTTIQQSETKRTKRTNNEWNMRETNVLPFPCAKRTSYIVHTPSINDLVQILVMNNVSIILCSCKPKWRSKRRKQNKFSRTHTHAHTTFTTTTDLPHLIILLQKNLQFNKINNINIMNDGTYSQRSGQ